MTKRKKLTRMMTMMTMLRAMTGTALEVINQIENFEKLFSWCQNQLAHSPVIILKQRFSLMNLSDLILALVFRGAFDSISSFMRWD